MNKKLLKERERKMKNSKGITLIALIITIVVLLILAVVAIRAVTGDGILQHAKNAQTEYQTAQGEENTTLQSYLDKIEANVPGGNNSGGDETAFPKATVGTKVDENSTINGEMYSSTNPVIPAGFKAINTETSKWDDVNGPQVTKGLVISDGTSEFVWIPVEDLNSFARVQAEGSTDYRGVLYDWKTDSTGKTEYTWTSTATNNIEPANLKYIQNGDNTDNADRFTTLEWTSTYYQESFNKMVESVTKYNGFYVGRYETSLNGSIAQSKSGEIPINSVNWWNMYEYSLAYSSNNTSLGVESEMIWGCQWDAMLKFILTTDDASHVTAKTNVGHKSSEFTTAPYKTGGANYTEVYSGSVTYNDKAVNIYDLEGNVYEWTQEAEYTTNRICRGGYYPANDYAPTGRGYDDVAWGTNSFCGSRLSLYVK